jgi:dTDP-4-dehydrorhamnose reductase
MKILVIGKDSQLGECIQDISTERKNDNSLIFIGRDLLDLSRKENISDFFRNRYFDVVVNCAAFTQVDKAETDYETANQINHLAVKELAKIAQKQKFKLIHISTDYVFDGKSTKPYKESDQPNPINAYGQSKLLGEKCIKEIMPINAIIIRTSWLYSEYGNNFVRTMINLGQVKEELSIINDQTGSPTYAGDLAKVILEIINSNSFLINNEKTEIYHFSNNGVVSWFNFAKEIFRITNIECKVNPIISDEYISLAKRPLTSEMSNDKISNKYNIKLIDWTDSLENCIDKILSKKYI